MGAPPVKVFLSYSHKDDSYREELETHLSLLRRQGLIDAWTDRRIAPGSEWASEISESLLQAELVLLLVSPSFIASDYCFDREMASAMEMHRQGLVRVIPIIVRPADWKDAPFATLQGLPRDGKPITSWSNHDEAWLDVAKGIRRVVESIQANPGREQRAAAAAAQYRAAAAAVAQQRAAAVRPSPPVEVGGSVPDSVIVAGSGNQISIGGPPAQAPAAPTPAGRPPGKRPTAASLRKVLNEVLRSAGDLDAFCLDYFPSVYARFVTGMDLLQKQNLLLQVAHRGEIVEALRDNYTTFASCESLLRFE